LSLKKDSKKEKAVELRGGNLYPVGRREIGEVAGLPQSCFLPFLLLLVDMGRETLKSFGKEDIVETDTCSG